MWSDESGQIKSKTSRGEVAIFQQVLLKQNPSLAWLSHSFFLAKRGKKGSLEIIFSDLFQTHGI